MTWILLTNDDGIDSPALPALSRALSHLAEVRVVAPDRERSWVGKALTRYEPLSVVAADRGGVGMLAVSGYPADCVQLGVHTLFDDLPALVVSGINVGFNHGSAFLGSSGTVGAAIEAANAGVTGLALSAGTYATPWSEWRPWALSGASQSMWERLAATAADLASPLLGAGRPLALTVNMPAESGPATPRRETTVAAVGYGSLFRANGDGTYGYGFTGALEPAGPLDGTDVEAAADGVVSVTSLGPPGGRPLDGELAARLRVRSS